MEIGGFDKTMDLVHYMRLDRNDLLLIASGLTFNLIQCLWLVFDLVFFLCMFGCIEFYNSCSMQVLKN